MKNIDLLTNKGFHIIGDKHEDTAQKTIVVVGLARSGTSLIAGALSHLGVYMGAMAKPPVFEDINLSSAVENKNHDRVRQIIDTYNSSYNLWGYKRPATLKNLSFLHNYFRNPCYIIIFRDIFSIGNRNRISVQADILKNMSVSLKEYDAIVSFLKKERPRALLTAFDKALNSKEELIQHLISFCGLSPEPEACQSAISFISPNPKDYLNASRITRTKGQIEKVNLKSVAGWARYNNDERPAEVGLFIENELIAKTVADRFAQHLLDKEIHSSGKCCFVFDQLPENWLQGKDQFRVKVLDDIQDLENSPYVIKHRNSEDNPTLKSGTLSSNGPQNPERRKKGKNSVIQTVYIHAGLHGAGTIEIQDGLFENRKFLKENNIVYPENWPRNHSLPLFLMFCEKSKRYTHHLIQRMGLSQSEVDNQRMQYRSHLMETIETARSASLVLSGQDVCALSGDSLDEMKNFFEFITADKIKIIFSIKSPIALVTERIKGSISNGAHLSESLYTQKEKVDYRERIEKFFSVFGRENVLFFDFDEAVNHSKGFLGFIGQMIGLKNREMVKQNTLPTSNRLLSDRAIDIISFINEKYPLRLDNNATWKRTSGDVRPLFALRGNEFCLPENVQEQIIARNQGDIEWLKSHVGLDYSKGKYIDLKFTSPFVLDQIYFQDIKSIYPKLSPTLKKGVKDYIQHKKNISGEQITQVTSKKICNMIKRKDFVQKVKNIF